MDGKLGFRIVAAIVLMAAIAGVAFLAFNAGVATHVQVPAPAAGQGMYRPYGFGFWPMFPFFGLGCFGPLLALLLLVLAVRAFAFMLFGPRWGRWGMHRAWRHGWDQEGGLPSMFKEWHDRAHGQPSKPDETNMP